MWKSREKREEAAGGAKRGGEPHSRARKEEENERGGGEPGEEETKKTKKKQPSEISEMTDTRFHPVEVTTMFVSWRYAGTQATFPSRFPVKLMAATS